MTKKLPGAGMTTDKVHNFNCFKFLKKIKLPVDEALVKSIPQINEIRSLQQSQYNQSQAYGDLYTRFMANLESGVKKNSFNADVYDSFFISLYENNNQILEETFSHILSTALEKTPSSPSLEKVIARKMRDRGANINSTTPSQAGSMRGRAMAFVSPDFKPSHRTSLATERSYAYNKDRAGSPKELRFGTQAQVHKYTSRISPLFKRFLKAQKNKKVQPSITHVYFNKLARDRSQRNIEGRFEMSLTRQLEQLEGQSDNVAVITLPADKGLIDHHDVADLRPTLSKDNVQQELLEIALENPDIKVKIKDFHISKKVRRLLFVTEFEEQEQLELLLDNSFNAMGFNGGQISPAQRQAVWMHFVNYELPRYILNKLKPETFNFSCKDAIDRGGIASAFYNLLSSLKTQPMSREEFEQALHAAPLMVKGRGINIHIDIIWNAIDFYIQANKKESSLPQWLMDWRDANCPPKRAGELLERRLDECIHDLEKRSNTNLVKEGLQILRFIKKNCDRSYAVNHPLWLDTVVSTFQFCQNTQVIQDQDKIDRYQNLISKMSVCDERPVGYMEAFFKLILSLFFMKQTSKEHSESYAQLLHKMGQWHDSTNQNDPPNEQDELIPKSEQPKPRH